MGFTGPGVAQADSDKAAHIEVVFHIVFIIPPTIVYSGLPVAHDYFRIGGPHATISLR